MLHQSGRPSHVSVFTDTTACTRTDGATHLHDVPTGLRSAVVASAGGAPLSAGLAAGPGRLSGRSQLRRVLDQSFPIPYELSHSYEYRGPYDVDLGALVTSLKSSLKMLFIDEKYIVNGQKLRKLVKLVLGVPPPPVPPAPQF